ncbi:MAG: hybrid sensor histidine kinase/response regulator [Calditrichaeota bacterium]|nr:MAG: hybrid sensor histidine kinase/response regulator [Calditrichota bacterium]
MLLPKDIQILVVDDEEMIRTVFQQSLELWGYQVDVAANGKIALEKCRTVPYHMVITDLNMPEMDGMMLLQKLKDEWPFIEVLVVTGYATIELAIEAMKLGAYDFILKPVNFDQVKFTIQKCYREICSRAENAELREINAQLRELNELKSKFLAITNHEIRTPLTIIKGYLEILEMVLNSRDPEVLEIFQILNNTVKDLQSTAERMHMLSLLNEGGWLGPAEQTNVMALGRSVGESMARLFRHRGIEFKMEFRPENLVIRIPHKAVAVLLKELLHNALKFTPDEGTVELVMWELPDWVVIRVRDTGIGIPVEKQDLIFKEFYEVQDTNNHKSSTEEFMGGGMGIGLALAREIVRTLKGAIEVESQPGSGSSFIVRLPKAPVSQVGQALAQMESASELSTKQ